MGRIKVNKEKYIPYGKEIIESLHRANERLRYSLNKSQQIQLNYPELSEEELEILESLCSRFARLSDILLQKAFRFIDIFELGEPDIQIQQRIDNAEHRRLIPNAETFKYIRELRNEIVHNYNLVDQNEFFEEIIKYSPILIKICDKTINYLKALLNSPKTADSKEKSQQRE